MRARSTNKTQGHGQCFMRKIFSIAAIMLCFNFINPLFAAAQTCEIVQGCTANLIYDNSGAHVMVSNKNGYKVDVTWTVYGYYKDSPENRVVASGTMTIDAENFVSSANFPTQGYTGLSLKIQVLKC